MMLLTMLGTPLAMRLRRRSWPPQKKAKAEAASEAAAKAKAADDAAAKEKHHADKVVGEKTRAEAAAEKAAAEKAAAAKAAAEDKAAAATAAEERAVAEYAWVIRDDDHLVSIHEKCAALGQALVAQGCSWQVKFSAGALNTTLSDGALNTTTLNKTLSDGALNTTTLNNSQFYDLRTQMNDSMGGPVPPPPDPEVLIAKFAEEGRKAWKAYQDSLLDMKGKLKDRPLLMDGVDERGWKSQMDNYVKPS